MQGKHLGILASAPRLSACAQVVVRQGSNPIAQEPVSKRVRFRAHPDTQSRVRADSVSKNIVNRFVIGLRCLSVILVLCIAPVTAHAQIGATTDIITGVVKDENGTAVDGASVEVTSAETNVTRKARTNAQGKYTVLFPDGGGQYRVTIRLLGKAPTVLQVQRQSDEDRLMANAVLKQTVTQIAGVTIAARQAPAQNAFERPTPGSTERALNSDQAARLPIDGSDLQQLALTAPGVVSITGSDSSGASFSVAGMRPDANNVTLDGVSFGASSVPQEAVRNTRVITSTYDVARGQFSGGLISSTTRGGSNTPQGNFSYSLRDQSLTVDGGDPSPLAQGYTQNQLSGGFGFPIIKDNLFAFSAVQLRRRDDVLPSLLNADAATLPRFGVAPDSVARFLSRANALGISPNTFFNDNRTQDNVSGLVRLDWLTPGGHSLTLRGDWRWNNQDPSRVGTLSLPQTGGTSKDWGGGVMATYTSNFGGRFLNELKTYYSVSQREARSFVTLPAGRIQVASMLDDGSQGIASLSFGGNAGLPSDGKTTALETTNETSWIAGNHRLKLGGLLNLSSFEQDVTFNRFGTFTFNSLNDFENNLPASFTRTLQPNVRKGEQLNAAAYLGDSWRLNKELQLTLGARLEGGRFGNAPAYNPAVEQAFGFKTNFVPSEVVATPRVGFSYFKASASGPPRFIIRGGFGEFRGNVSPSLFSSAASATGLQGAQSQLICTGESVPTPAWALFGTDVSNIPMQCLGGGAGPVPTQRPNVTVFDRDFAAPRSWRGSLGGQKFIFGRYNLNLDLSYARGVAQTGYRDVNLQATPQFTIASEGGRPVYVPASTIVPATGTTTLLASRVNQAFGQVLTVGSDLATTNRQLTLSIGGITRRGAIINVGYTLASSKDQSSMGFGGGFASLASTAANPNIREWAPSDFDRRHSINGTVTYPFNLSFELTAFGRWSSGAPFTPTVGSDINGDGARNDRAFIFDPASTQDPVVKAGMQTLLANAPNDVRACLESQTGSVATRNSCRGVWQPSLDLQLNWRPNMWGLNRRLALSLVTNNLIGGLDRALHGSNNLHGWGSFRGQDNTLLYVRGFDATTNRYIYQVNERFGASRQGQNGISVPFQIGLQARYTVGPDRMRDMIASMMRGGGGGGPGFGGFGGPGGPPGGGPPGAAGGAAATTNGAPTDFAARAAAALNPIQALVQLRDTIGLTDDQISKLRPIADSLGAKNQRLQAEMQKEMKNAGANPDFGALMGRMRPRTEAMQKNSLEALKEAQAILTPAQWAKVPDRIKTPRSPFGGPGGQNGQPARRPPAGS